MKLKNCLNFFLLIILASCVNNPEPEFDSEKIHSTVELVKDTMFNEDRFSKIELATGNLNEPLEMAILPNLDILIIQRKGEIVLFDSKFKKLETVGKLETYCENRDFPFPYKSEEGLLGLTIDPDFKNNNFIYLFYSVKDSLLHRLSRFVFKNRKLENASEKVILEFYAERKVENHTGGSLTFGNDRILFLSTGDNSTQADQKNSLYKLSGYAPIDDRVGFKNHDARRTSSNTFDLRGKIIRIKINEDGSYSIPENNLFPIGTPKTRPEIYVMGNRNPYRISIDKKTNFLYWGEVGPDASVDSLATKGPKGYDEINQARVAGNFGWPLFVGNNIPYHDYNYENGKVGPLFNPLKPQNNSKNNTGMIDLPPVAPPFIWYSYSKSNEFPTLGSGGRSAMAGPIYYGKDILAEDRYPESFEGKLFIYDWVRDWVKTVSMKPDGSFEKISAFMPSQKWNGILDMELGPDGKIYVLEYGKGWYTNNFDAALSRIDYYPGNKPPIVKLNVVKKAGSIPFQLALNADATIDEFKDSLKYNWHIGDSIYHTKSSNFKIELNMPGEYIVYVECSDNKGAIGKSKFEKIVVGNEPPNVKIVFTNNDKTYSGTKPIKYKILIDDKEDGSFVDSSKVLVKVDFSWINVYGNKSINVDDLKNSNDKLEIMESLDCRSCHKNNEMSMGPSFLAVSTKYKNNPNAIAYLSNKIKKGGSGVWGNTAMPAHPDLSDENAKTIVNWVLGLNENGFKSLPMSGEIIPTKEQDSLLLNMNIYAFYTDKGTKVSKPQTGMASITLKNKNISIFDKIIFKLKQIFKL